MTLNVNPIQAKILLERKGKVVDALKLFRPTEHQEEFFRTFSLTSVLEVILGGGNRSGKSTCAAVALAAFIRNEPITLRDGTELHMRPEHWRNEALKVWIIGYDWTHIGKTLFRLLFRGDLFRMIRDTKTGKWRAWDPSRPEDADKRQQTRPCPPLIRPSDIKGGDDAISWENKKDRQIKSCEFHDGTRAEFFASTGAGPQGDPAHVIWIDEKMDNEAWYSELMVRLIDHRGRLLWTTWPTTAPSSAMTEATERAAEQKGKPNQKTYSFVLKGSDNPFTKSDHRDAIMSTMDEDTRRARDEGVLGMDRWRVYNRFSKYVHRAMSQDPAADDELAKCIRGFNGIPYDWTRYLILDPGTANPAVLFVAVPPPKFGDYIVPYDELYMHYTSAKPLAEAIKAKTQGQYFEDFIIDAHAARQTPMGFDGTIGSNYEKEFAACNLRCRRRGSRFSFGSDNVDGRILRLQGVMNINEKGFPKLRILGCPTLVRQLELYKWKSDSARNPLDKPADKQKIDMAQALEYFVSRDDCGYVAPIRQVQDDPRGKDSVMKHFRSFFGKQPKVEDKSVYCGVGVRPSI